MVIVVFCTHVPILGTGGYVHACIYYTFPTITYYTVVGCYFFKH